MEEHLLCDEFCLCAAGINEAGGVCPAVVECADLVYADDDLVDGDLGRQRVIFSAQYALAKASF